MRVLEDMCEILEDELKEITKKGDISPTELDSVYKSVDILKDIETIKAMKSGGYSNDSYARDGRSYNSYEGSYGSYGSYDGNSNNSYRGGDGMSNARRGRDGDGDGQYSERRGRDAMGRYTSRDDGYSRHNETEQLRKELMEMQKKMEQMR